MTLEKDACPIRQYSHQIITEQINQSCYLQWGKSGKFEKFMENAAVYNNKSNKNVQSQDRVKIIK